MSSLRPATALDAEKDQLLSNGEIHYLWWYMQGSIMSPRVRERLCRAWGFCERHAWGAILVEASFRHGYLHGPAILYEDIMSLAVSAMDLKGPLKDLRLSRALRDRGPCMMCEMGLGAESRGAADPGSVLKGRDASELRLLARESRRYWEKTVCGRCSGSDSLRRCRRHLIDDASRGRVEDFSSHRDLTAYISEQMSLLARSFRWEFRGTVTVENKAALISAVGWCSGWPTFLSMLGIER